MRTKKRLTPLELQTELQRRLDGQGLGDCIAGLPTAAPRAVYGRNWQVEVRTAEHKACGGGEAIARIVRETGNEIDCRFRMPDKTGASLAGLSFLRE